MSKLVLVNGDKAMFQPTFGAATVVVRPGSLTGSGPATLGGKKLCVDGDEKSVSVSGCMYTTSSHPVPGTGTLEIESLGSDQKASKTKTGDKVVLMVGGKFTAKLSVQSPASVIVAGATVSDPLSTYSGSGTFVSTNRKLKGA